MSQKLSALPIGAKVKDVTTSYNNKPIVWQVAGKDHYAAQQVTLLSKDIITLKAFDAKEAANTDSNRKNYGNNRYSQSNLRQWLNSNASAWYAAQHSADAPPNNENVWSNNNEYDAESGFLTNFSANLRNALQNTSLTVARNTVVDSGGSETITDKVFLLSNTEVGLANENGVAEGKLLAMFSSDTSRLAYPTAEAVTKSEYKDTTNLLASKPWYWWLRTPYAGYSYVARSVNSSGALDNYIAYYGHYGVRPALNLSSEILVSDSPDADGAYAILWNAAPVPTLTTSDNKTLYEGDSFVVDGSVTDSDNGDVVTIKASIDGGSTRALHTAISNGSTPIVFNKNWTFKSGKLYEGSTVLTDTLAAGTPHILKVWAEDDKSNKSVEVVRTFYAVPNRAPALTIDAVTPEGSIDNDSFAISGTTSDPDANDVVVTYKINSGTAIEIHRGAPGSFNFNVALRDLKVGDNSIVVEVTDTYSFKASRTIKLTKSENAATRTKATVRYPITPPTGTANGVRMWIRRSSTLQLEAFASLTLKGEQENYKPMELLVTAPVSGEIVEDDFVLTADEPKQNVVVKLVFTQTHETDHVKEITGVIN